MIPTTTELLLEWDAHRERSLQAEMGMSALGGCRRQAGYMLAGTEREQSSGSVQAVMGTAVHETAAEAARQSIKIPPHAFVETKDIWFAGLRGHPDLFVEPILRDIKTTGRSSMLALWKAQGPPKRHVWQVSFYGAGLIVDGHKVERLQIDYLARDSGDTWLWEAPFRMEPVREAMNWLTMVRSTPADMLARDFRPGSPQCDSCPFARRCWQDQAVPGRDLRSVLYIENPDAAEWARRLEDARARKKQAEMDEADAKGALDALRPNDYGTADVEVPALDQVIRFQVQKGRSRLDAEQVKADYRRVDATPPMIQGDPVVKISLASKPE